MASDLVIFDLNDITETTNIEIVKTSIVDSKLQILLQQFNLIEAYQPLIDCGFSFERLQYISQDDLNKIFPEKKYCGLVAELREKIFIWKTENFPDKFTTLSANSHVNKWIASNSGFQNSPKSDSSTLCSLSVGDILKASNTGKTVLQFYADNTFLNKDYRKKLLSSWWNIFMSTTTRNDSIM